MAKNFTVPTSSALKPTSPENVYPTFLPGARAGDIKNLWLHQGDVLRAYVAKQSARDIALELPTGAGKSLVGLLIAEYRRQALGERIVFLCPTRQLARQLHRQSLSYGFLSVALVGKQAEYDPKDFSAYNQAEKIAITTYNGVFNTNPKIGNANCLLLDDAHSAENYIAQLWSVRILRTTHRATYDAVIDLFADAINDSLLFTVRDDESRGRAVGIVPQETLWERSVRLREIVAAGARDLEEKRAAESFHHAWRKITAHLDACIVYLSWREILIRPLSPPTETHAPFAGANQRIYMSATLGHGGDLERSLGVRRIERLGLPPGWDRQATGRRLFLMPGVSLREDQAEQVAAKFAARPGRLLVLTTDRGRLKHIEDTWLKNTGKKVLHADDVEDDLAPFVSERAGALVLTNRYDGIDLPDDACRAMVIDGLPSATNLQEQFLTDRLGAHAMLRERMRTRIIQAMGRCTRNQADHAIVLILGEKLNAFLEQRDVRAAMHPELQAELQVALTNAADNSVDDFGDLAALFKTVGWDPFERFIVQERQVLARVPDPVSGPLEAAVSDEVAYVYAAWNGDWKAAAEFARSASDAQGGDELKPYRGLWYYLTANATRRAKVQPDLADAAADNLLEKAIACSPPLNAFLRRANSGSSNTSPASQLSDHEALAIKNASEQLAELGASGMKFDKRMQAVRVALEGDKSKPFEGALDDLGRLLGFDVMMKPREKAVPDSVWHLGRTFVIGWEAKNEEKPDKPIGIGDLRQANGHFDWVKAKLKLPSTDGVSVVLVTPRYNLDKDAPPFATKLHYATLEDAVSLHADVARALTAARATAGGLGEARLANAVRDEFRKAKLLPQDIRARFGMVSHRPVFVPDVVGANPPKPGSRS